MTCAGCGAEMCEVEPDEKPIDVMIEHFREEHATDEQFAFLLEDE